MRSRRSRHRVPGLHVVDGKQALALSRGLYGTEADAEAVAQEARDKRLRRADAAARPRMRLEAPRMSEADVLRSVLKYLDVDERVAWVVRSNNVAAQDANGRPVRSVLSVRGGPVPGWPDIVGQMRSGVLLAIECKSSRSSWRSDEWLVDASTRPEHELGPEAARIVAQWRMLDLVRQYSGVAGVVWGPSPLEMVDRILG